MREPDGFHLADPAVPLGRFGGFALDPLTDLNRMFEEAVGHPILFTFTENRRGGSFYQRYEALDPDDWGSSSTS